MRIRFIDGRKTVHAGTELWRVEVYSFDGTPESVVARVLKVTIGSEDDEIHGSTHAATEAGAWQLAAKLSETYRQQDLKMAEAWKLTASYCRRKARGCK